MTVGGPPGVPPMGLGGAPPGGAPPGGAPPGAPPGIFGAPPGIFGAPPLKAALASNGPALTRVSNWNSKDVKNGRIIIFPLAW